MGIPYPIVEKEGPHISIRVGSAAGGHTGGILQGASCWVNLPPPVLFSLPFPAPDWGIPANLRLVLSMPALALGVSSRTAANTNSEQQAQELVPHRHRDFADPRVVRPPL
jgi:hypothetical protein